MKINKKYIISIIIAVLAYPVGNWVFWKCFVKMPPDSLVQILSNPEKFHEREIKTQGYLIVEFEEDALYLRKEDADYGMTANSVWVELTDEMKANPEKYNGKHVYIRGTFNAKAFGHLWNHSGYIHDITHCHLLSLRDTEKNESNKSSEPILKTPVD